MNIIEGFRRVWVLFVVVGAIMGPVWWAPVGVLGTALWITIGAVVGLIAWAIPYYVFRGFVKKD